MSTSGERKNALKLLKNLFFTPKMEVKEYREKLDKAFSSPVLPNRVECVERNIGGVNCDFLSPESYNSRRLIIYIHGGCFIGGSCKAYRPFVASLANSMCGRAIIPDFKLAPTHPYPAGMEDLQTVFRTIYTEELVINSLDYGSDLEKSRPEIIIAADGSGASLAMGLVLGLSSRFRSAVKHVVLFSPWLDVSTDSPKFQSKKTGDNLFTAEAMRRCAELYTFQNNRNIPEVSPLKAPKEQLAGFPPVYIQMGGNEFTVEDAVIMQQKLLEAGAKCQLDVWPEMESMFQLADEYLSEPHLAVEKIGKIFTTRKITKEDSQLEAQFPVVQDNEDTGDKEWN